MKSHNHSPSLQVRDDDPEEPLGDFENYEKSGDDIVVDKLE